MSETTLNTAGVCGKITVSFLSAPGELFKYVAGDSTIWSIEKPSSRTCTRNVCVPVAAK